MVGSKTFNAWFDQVIKRWEGGAAERPKEEDSGGLTNHGVTIGYWQKEAHKYVNAPPTREALLQITWDDARIIAWKGFWLKHKINQVRNQALQPFVADSYWLGGKLKSLGYPSLQALNRDLTATPGKLYRKRLAWLKTLKNWSFNSAGWTNRMNSVLKLGKKINRKRMLLMGGGVVVLGTGVYFGIRYLNSR